MLANACLANACLASRIAAASAEQVDAERPPKNQLANSNGDGLCVRNGVLLSK